jgi:hypothetical protein
MLWPSIFAKFLEGSKGTEKICAPATREECNNYDLLLPVSRDWPIMMIGPGGLLLVISHLFVRVGHKSRGEAEASGVGDDDHQQ